MSLSKGASAAQTGPLASGAAKASPAKPSVPSAAAVRAALLCRVEGAVAASPEFAIEVLSAVERGHAARRKADRREYSRKDAGFLAAVALATTKRRTESVMRCLIPTIARAIYPPSASNCELDILEAASAIEARRVETTKIGSVACDESAVAKPDAQTPGESA